ncbi:MAG: DUF1566 domain-containing protein [Candidatus Hydrogenedentes bacterium]|nr:DUF1566 domain-containing protein [Candidatus Hydrogenedentota bacterium]
MKHVSRQVLTLLLALTVILSACGVGGKQSAVEGKLVDWTEKPVSGVKITASQVQPIKGYEQFEAVTKSDGTFRMGGLFPSFQYVVKPWSDKWTCETAVRLDSAPQGETAILPSPMVIAQAFSTGSGSLIIDLGTGKTRFTVSLEGVIADAQTGLDWIVGPDRGTNYAHAEQWVAACNVAAGGWRMPTQQELRSLYQQGVGERNMDPVFNTTGWLLWAEPGDSSSAWGFNFGNGGEGWPDRDPSSFPRVFGVRSPR